jgi:hygromycin-B 7''-O-kinase
LARLVPPFENSDDLWRLRTDASAWKPALDAILGRHELHGSPELLSTGSRLVATIGDRFVLKLYGHWEGDHAAVEAQCLEWLEGRLPIRSPELVASGELEGCPYLIQRRLAGVPLREARAGMPPRDLFLVAETVGRLARALHALPVPVSFDRFPDWNGFLASLRQRCTAWHRARELPAALLEAMDDQLSGVSLETESPVFLHTELTDTNLMVEQAPDGWRLSGVLDFEPATLGHPLYDLAAIPIFVAHGDLALCRAALGAYGLTVLDESLRRHLLAALILHRYSHIGFFLDQVGIDQYPEDWNGVARHLFGF